MRNPYCLTRRMALVNSANNTGVDPADPEESELETSSSTDNDISDPGDRDGEGEYIMDGEWGASD